MLKRHSLLLVVKNFRKINIYIDKKIEININISYNCPGCTKTYLLCILVNLNKIS